MIHFLTHYSHIHIYTYSRTHDVVLCELERIPERVIHVGLRRKVHDGINLFSLDHEVDQIGAADVALHELVVGVVLDLVQVGEARAVCVFGVGVVSVCLKW